MPKRTDINKILKIVNVKETSNLEIVITPKWKETILSIYQTHSKNLIPEMMKETVIKEQGKLAMQYAKKLLKNKQNMPYSFDRKTEFNIINGAKKYIESITNTNIEVVFWKDKDYEYAKAIIKQLKEKV